MDPRGTKNLTQLLHRWENWSSEHCDPDLVCNKIAGLTQNYFSIYLVSSIWVMKIIIKLISKNWNCITQSPSHSVLGRKGIGKPNPTTPQCRSEYSWLQFSRHFRIGTLLHSNPCLLIPDSPLIGLRPRTLFLSPSCISTLAGCFPLGFNVFQENFPDHLGWFFNVFFFLYGSFWCYFSHGDSFYASVIFKILLDHQREAVIPIRQESGPSVQHIICSAWNRARRVFRHLAMIC